jgi:hypothetical protein
MQTVKIQDRVESETQKARWVLFLKPEEDDPNYESLVTVSEASDEELAILAKKLKTSPELLTEIASYFQNLQDAIHQDLADIWARLP